MNYPAVKGLSFVVNVDAEREWHCVRDGKVLAIICQSTPFSLYDAVYLGYAKPFVSLSHAKEWLRRIIAATVHRYGSVEAAETAHETNVLAIIRRRMLVAQGDSVLFPWVSDARYSFGSKGLSKSLRGHKKTHPMGSGSTPDSPITTQPLDLDQGPASGQHSLPSAPHEPLDVDGAAARPVRDMRAGKHHPAARVSKHVQRSG